ncbi:MAG TPA: trypsin-like peptidase domain-containing protein [Chloroflexota bacterium]|nr:trypsin-like peptidase domain-containing protein [Chloroflexota bacterium]
MAIAQGASGLGVTDELATMAESLRRSTVQVRSGRMGGGSGIIWRADGLIVTNAHVVRADAVEVELDDGRRFEGTVLDTDRARDLAAVRIGATGLPAAPIGDSDALRVGQLVMAVGNPLGLSGALTLGIVHAIAPARGDRQPWVQADVRLAPGNSGGPLADVQGRVLGVNSMIAGGLGLAVPSNAVRRFLGRGEDRPYLGVTLQPVMVPVAGRPVPGMLVLDVEAEGPAEHAGILMGDVVVGAAGRLFDDPSDLAASIGDVPAGRSIRLEIVRGGQQTSRDVLLRALAGKGVGRAA